MASVRRILVPFVAAAVLAACENPFGTSTGRGGGGGPAASDAKGEAPAKEPPGTSTADSLVLDTDVDVAYSSPEARAGWDVSLASCVAYYSPGGDGRIKLSWSQPPHWWHPGTTITIRATSSIEAPPVGPFGSKIYLSVTGGGADVADDTQLKTSYAGRAASGELVPGDTKVAEFTLRRGNKGAPQRLVIALEYGPVITYLYKP